MTIPINKQKIVLKIVNTIVVVSISAFCIIFWLYKSEKKPNKLNNSNYAKYSYKKNIERSINNKTFLVSNNEIYVENKIKQFLVGNTYCITQIIDDNHQCLLGCYAFINKNADEMQFKINTPIMRSKLEHFSESRQLKWFYNFFELQEYKINNLVNCNEWITM